MTLRCACTSRAYYVFFVCRPALPGIISLRVGVLLYIGRFCLWSDVKIVNNPNYL